MDFHQLQYFNTVASFENMSKAAEVLHISQPTLSKYISKLEYEIGYPLFDRNGKKITLNRAGQDFLEYSVEALRTLDEGVKKASETAFGNTGSVNICIIGDCSKLIKYAISYSNENNIGINIEEYFNNADVPDINKYDVIVCPDTKKYDSLSGIPLYENRAFLAVSSSHELASKILLTDNDLSGLKMVFLKQGDTLEASLWSMQIMDIKPAGMHFVNSSTLKQTVVENAAGCGIVYEDSMSEYTNSKKIRVIPISDKRFNIPMKICFKREKHLSDEAKQFVQYLYKAFNL